MKSIPTSSTLFPYTTLFRSLLEALTTDYELGAIKLIPMKMHLMADYVVAAFLVLSPWLFGKSRNDVVRHEMHLRSEEHTSELQSHSELVCRLLLEKTKQLTQ